ncbi:MAG TPA: proton-conducting transporter membrane subunit, partial [Deinococcales bacterium]|nr:proton-conducting transporter membrane subunit [Deinococcales bacterium]
MNLVALPVLVPLVSGLLLLAVPTRTARHVLSMLAGAATLAASVGILSQAAAGNTLVSSLGGWPAPFGIVLVADGFSGVMVVLSAITGLATVSYAGGAADSRREGYGQPALLQFLFTGVNMSFLTGDLFNLFVAFEVMLIASYALLVLGGTRRQLREGFRYVVVNLLASAVFVTAAGLTYGILGTLNMAHLAERAAALGPDRTVTALALLLASVFATKTALFPLAFWLPASYPAPPPLISAYFGGMLTKVGVYALVRLLVT